MAFPYTKRTVTIASGSSTSKSLLMDTNIDTIPQVICGVLTDTTITANIAWIEYSPDDITWYKLYDSAGNQLTFAVSAAAFIALIPTFYAVTEKFIRVKTNANVSAAVNFNIYTRAP